MVSKNVKVVTLRDGTQVLLSYGVPVVAHMPNNGYIATTQWYSVTTTRHINKWLDGIKPAPCSQEYLNDILTKG